MDRTDVRTITKKELCERIAERTGEKRATVKRVLKEFLGDIVSELAVGNRIEFREFGVFEIKTRAARTAQNPRTLQRVPVPERRSVKFKPGSAMRAKIDAATDQMSTPPADANGEPLPSLAEPKAGVRPDTGKFVTQLDGIHIDGKPAQEGQPSRRA